MLVGERREEISPENSSPTRTWQNIYIERHPHRTASFEKTPSTKDLRSNPSGMSTVSSGDPSESLALGGFRLRAATMLRSRACVAVVNVCILANTVTVALEQTTRLKNTEVYALTVAEHVFISMFTMELMLRLYADRLHAFRDAWIWLDLFLVSVAIIANWILPGFGLLGSSGHPLTIALVLRTARLARVARAVRLVHNFSNLWLLVHAFLTSSRMVAYVFAVVALVLYIFNAIALELIPLRYMGQADLPEDIKEIVDTQFSSLGASMMTLVQFLCLDSIASIYKPLSEYDWVLAIYFMMLVMVVGVVLMNVITAVIVNNALHQSNEDKELVLTEERRRKERLMEDIYGIFLRLDRDNSGQLSLEELLKVKGRDARLLAEFSGDMDPADVFRMLDIDRNGRLGIYEFCEGLYESVVGQSRVELRNLTRHVHHIADTLSMHRKDLVKIQVDLKRLVDTVVNESVMHRTVSSATGDMVDLELSRRLPVLVGSGSYRLTGASAGVSSPEPPIVDESGCSWGPQQEGSYSTITDSVLPLALGAASSTPADMPSVVCLQELARSTSPDMPKTCCEKGQSLVTDHHVPPLLDMEHPNGDALHASAQETPQTSAVQMLAQELPSTRAGRMHHGSKISLLALPTSRPRFVSIAEASTKSSQPLQSGEAREGGARDQPAACEKWTAGAGD